ncbi:hypothetical protein [Kribbella lupini]|uniref:hypothetical protein n=1 Tax=Kribbella lupini TaxID=291602 RepID=UPI0031D8AEA8
MSLFSEEEQAAPRRTPLRSKRVRRTAACIALPIGLYAALAVVGLLPLPGAGDSDAATPVAGLPIVDPADQSYPRVEGDPRPAVTPTPVLSTESLGVGRGDAQSDSRAGDSAGRPTPGVATTGTAEDPTRRVLPTITARPPVLPTPGPTEPPAGTPAPSPSSPPSPSSSPSPSPTGTPPVTDHPSDPGLVEGLLGWLDALVP